jgi:hypothetical protein
MKFKRHDKYSQVSEDGRYSVCAIGMESGGHFYEAHRRRAHEDGPGLISTNLPSAAEARAACEADAND